MQALRISRWGWPLGVWNYDPRQSECRQMDGYGRRTYHRRATALAGNGTNDLLYSLLRDRPPPFATTLRAPTPTSGRT